MELIEKIIFIVIVIFATITIVLKIIVERGDKQLEKKVEDNLDRISETIEVSDNSDSNNVLLLMVNHVRELRVYYAQTRRQANFAFITALIICIIGVSVFFRGLIFSETEPTVLSTIAGAIVEIIAGLFFWLYGKTLSQLSLFHVSLQRSANVLLSIQLVEKVSESERDNVYKDIILKIIESEYKLTSTIADDSK